MVTSYTMNDQLSSAKCVAEVIQVKGLTLSACQAIRCTCLQGSGAGPSGRGLHTAQFLKDFTLSEISGILF